MSNGWSYTPNHVDTGRWLREDPQLRQELRRRAEMGLSLAASLMHRRTGDLAASGQVVDNGIGGYSKDRMELAVTFEIPYAVDATFHDAQNVALDALHAAKAVIEGG